MKLTFLGVVAVAFLLTTPSILSVYGDKWEECFHCEGTGLRECFSCDGTGIVKCPRCMGDGYDTPHHMCYKCDGTGIATCGRCDGKGWDYCNYCDGKGGRWIKESVPEPQPSEPPQEPQKPNQQQGIQSTSGSIDTSSMGIIFLAILVVAIIVGVAILSLKRK